jgi:predicted acyl esterase
MHPIRCLVPTVLVACLTAQCVDPPAPAAGFAVTLAADQLVTFTDAYRTRADVRHPSAAPGACGWPLLVAVHGFPGSKAGPIAAMSASYAARGYCVVTYDVRGQGSGIALNPGRGTTLMGLNEWIDMFEVMEWAAAAFPGVVDRQRIGVLGISQGGAHSFAAAAWSGRTPPANPRRSAPFPVVRAVAPTVMVPSHTDAATLDGTAFVDSWAILAFAPPGPQLAMDAAFQAVMRAHVLASDPAGMRTWMRSDPGRDFQHLLPSSTTAVLATMAWLDETMNANSTLAAVQSMSAAAGRRVFLTTGNHGTPDNAYETARVDAVRRAWFERHLKAGTEPVESGPPVTSACLPSRPSEYLGANTLWRHRADPSFPPATATTTTYYLRQGAALATSPPTSAESPETIVHSVPAGYDVIAWRADGAGQNLALALARIPLSTATYETPPASTDVELAGIPQLTLEVTPQQANFLLAARLEVVVPGNPPQVVSQGGLGVRQAGGPAPAPVTIEMGATACVVPAGARLRLSVQNHYLGKAAATESFRYMPMFTSAQVALEHRPGAASRLQLPVRPTVRIDVATTATQVALAAPAPVNLDVRSATAHAGAAYWLVCSLSGQGPALALSATEQLYLAPDALTLAFLGASGSALLPGFAGVLDATGRANAALAFNLLAPLPSELLGARLHLAPLELQNGALGAGAPLELEFR